MGALANGTTLRRDPDFQSWIETAIGYQSRVVIGEPATTADHAIRLRLARDAAPNPSVVLAIMVTGVCTDPAVASKGDTPALVGEQLVIDKVGELWTPIAKLTYPNG